MIRLIFANSSVEKSCSTSQEKANNVTKSTLKRSIEEPNQLLDGNDPGVERHERHLPTPPEFTGEEIKKIRQQIPATQLVFAQIMAASPRTVQAWETNRSKPNGPARRLMQLLELDPSVARLLM